MNRITLAVQTVNWTWISGAVATVFGLCCFIPGFVREEKARREYVRQGRIRLDEAEQR